MGKTTTMVLDACCDPSGMDSVCCFGVNNLDEQSENHVLDNLSQETNYFNKDITVICCIQVST